MLLSPPERYRNYKVHPPQDLSGARRCREVFESFWLLIRRGDIPPGAAAFIIKERGLNPSSLS
jgi:hypothetical protein